MLTAECEQAGFHNKGEWNDDYDLFYCEEHPGGGP